MDITLRSSSQAALSGSTSTLMSQQSVCHSCYEIYITEQKLMRAEKLFAKATGVPDRPRRNGRGGKDVVKNFAMVEEGPKVKAEELQEAAGMDEPRAKRRTEKSTRRPALPRPTAAFGR